MKITFISDGTEETQALARTTHLCIAAHEDDIEFMAYAPIAECFGKKDKWFCGVVVTDGAGSPRSGLYADHKPTIRLTISQIFAKNQLTRVDAYNIIFNCDNV